MFSQVKQKLNNKHGETIAETLVSVLIVAICMVMLANAVVTAGKINNVSRDDIVPFNVEGATSISATGCSISIERGTNSTNVNGMTCKKTNGGYFYYE